MSSRASSVDSNQGVDESHSFLTFLAAAQNLGVDLLPITWQASLEDVGAGGTAEIRQALLSAEMSFAFKRIDWFHHRIRDVGRAYELLTTEVTVMAQESLRSHRNILKLEGICWDFHPKDKAIRPVLVFEKSILGDLESFLRSNSAALTMDHRFALCNDVANGLVALRSAGIIHGDVKPANVLVFRYADGGYCAKLADFGHVAIRTDPDARFRLPQSQPWSPPEYHDGYWSYEAVGKAEMYAFGLLCAWVLFQHEYSQQSPHLTNNYTIVTEIKERHDFEDLLLDLCKRTGVQHSTARCTAFFKNAFSPAAGRSAEPTDFLGLFHSTRERSNHSLPEHIASKKLDPWQSTFFQLAPSVFQLLKADYDVRQYVIEQLKEQGSAKNGNKATQNACFQVALASKIGFGCTADDGRATVWLQGSGKSLKDLEAEIDKIKEADYNQDDQYINPNITLWERQGYLDGLDRRYSHQKITTLEKIEHQYVREVEDMGKTFQKDHPIMLLLNFLLGDVFTKKGEYRRARFIQEEALALMESNVHYGPAHRSTLDLKSSLAATLYKLGDYQGAVTVGTMALKDLESTAGALHISTLIGLDSMSLYLCAQGYFENALAVNKRALDGKVATLGPQHPHTLGSQSNMVTILTSIGRLHEALEISERNVDALIKVLGESHQITFVAKNNHAMLMHMHGDDHGAKILSNKVLRGTKESLGEQHPDVMMSLLTQSVIVEALGQLEEAWALITDALHQSRTFLGEDHPQTLQFMSQAGLVLQDLGRYDEALDQHRAVMERRKLVLGESHPDTITSLANTAAILHLKGSLGPARRQYEAALAAYEERYHQSRQEALSTKGNFALLLCELGEYENAEALVRDTKHQAEMIYGKDNTAAFHERGTLGVVLYRSEKLDEAEAVERQLLDDRLRVLGDKDLSTLSSKANLAAVLYKKGKLAEGASLCEAALEGRISLLGPEHPATLFSKSDFGAYLADLGRFDQSEAMLSDAYAAQERIIGRCHPNALATLEILAALYYSTGNYAKSRETYEKAIEGYNMALGEEHRSTLRTEKNLANVLPADGKLDEAEALARRVYRICNNKYGAEDSITLSALGQLAPVLESQGKLEEAQSMVTDLLAVKRRVLGLHDISTLRTMNTLAVMRLNAGDLTGAIELSEEVLDSRRRILGPTHKETLVSETNIGEMYRQMGRLAEAESHCETAMTGLINTLGLQHTLTINGMNNYALALMDENKLDEAERITRAAVCAVEALPDAGTALVRGLLWSLVAILDCAEKVDEAQMVQAKLLNIYEAQFGPDHIETVGVVMAMANRMYLDERLTDALALYRTALERLARTRPEGDEDLEAVKGGVMELLLEIREAKQAEVINER